MKTLISSGLVFLLVSMSFLAPTLAIPNNPTINEVAEWTVMFYFAGDQLFTTYSLAEKMLADLDNLEKIGSTIIVR